MQANIKKIFTYPALILFVVVLVSHASYILNGFTWLDHGDIENRQAIAELSDFKKIFFSPFGETNFYRPIVTIFHSIDSTIYGTWAPGFHITNILLHVLGSIFAYLFIRKFFELTQTESLIAAIIFGIHPLSWLPVGAISYRPEILVTLFTLASLVAYFEYHAKHTQKSLLLFYLSALLALLSKETALFLIPALIILYHYKNSTNKKAFSRKTLLTLLTLISLYGTLHAIAIPKLWSIKSPQWNLSESIGTRILALEYRLTEIPSPITPALADTIVKTPIADWRVFATITAVIALLLFTFSKKTNASERKAVLFIFITLLPALNIIPLPRLSSPHYGYFPAIGIGVLFTLLLRRHYFFRFIIGAWIIGTSSAAFSN